MRAMVKPRTQLFGSLRTKTQATQSRLRSVGDQGAKTGAGTGENKVGRRGVLSRSLASTVVLAALGGYAGYVGFFGKSRSSNVAMAASSGTKSSLGYDLGMTKDEIDLALKDLSDLSVKVTMQVSSFVSFRFVTWLLRPQAETCFFS